MTKPESWEDRFDKEYKNAWVRFENDQAFVRLIYSEIKSFIADEIKRVKDSARVDEEMLKEFLESNECHNAFCCGGDYCEAEESQFQEPKDIAKRISQSNPIIFEEKE